MWLKAAVLSQRKAWAAYVGGEETTSLGVLPSGRHWVPGRVPGGVLGLKSCAPQDLDVDDPKGLGRP